MEKKHGLSKLAYKNDKLHFDGLDLHGVLAKLPTPLYLYSENSLRENYLNFQSAVAKAFKDFQICFALKANPNPELLKILASMGSGADIVSGGELQRAIASGIPASKIVFSGVGKTKKEIKQALEAGIYSFNVESFSELSDINALAREVGGVQARVAFRLNPKVKAITHKHISTGYKTHKFGILKEDILASIDKEEYWSHAKLTGLSVHIGSQLMDLAATEQAVKAVSECAQELPLKLEFIDVGGGLGVDYVHESPKAPGLDQYMTAIKNNLNPGYPVKVVFEPGRRIVASAGIFLATVIRSKTSADCRFLIVDGGMNDFARPSLYQAWHEIYPSRTAEKLIETDVVGPICETADCFGEKRMLPELQEDEFVAIADTGAYGSSMSSNYNLRARPSEALIDLSGQARLIETFSPK